MKMSSTDKDELSEAYIKENCPHCDQKSEAYKYLLDKTANFSVIVDPYPIVEGHILIIPKKHLSCIAEYSAKIEQEFQTLYKKVSEFIKKEYGSVSSFEHGKFGQTVFHSHVHLLPFSQEVLKIVPEGVDNLTTIRSFSALKDFFKKDGGYLFFSIESNSWVVNPALTAPRFFRDRFALALKRPRRGNWKKMHLKENGHTKPELDAIKTQQKWRNRYG